MSDEKERCINCDHYKPVVGAHYCFANRSTPFRITSPIDEAGCSRFLEKYVPKPGDLFLVQFKLVSVDESDPKEKFYVHPTNSTLFDIMGSAWISDAELEKLERVK